MAHFFKKNLRKTKLMRIVLISLSRSVLMKLNMSILTSLHWKKSSLIICCNCCDLFNQLIRVHYFGVEYLVMGH